MNKISVRLIAFGSAEHELEINLRTRVLRDPLGLKYSRDELEKEADEHHLGAFLDCQLVGCLLLKELPSKIMKMRQVAVDSSVQGQGVGKKLVIFSEDFSRSRGFTEIELHARENVIPFYRTLGYKTEGEPFTEVTIKHMKMRKIL